MAEVKIGITADDRTDAAFAAVERNVRSLAGEMKDLNETSKGASVAGWMGDLERRFRGDYFLDLSELTRRRGELVGELGRVLGVSLESAGERVFGSLEQGVGSLKERLSGLSLDLDASGALRAIGEVHSAADSLALTKTLVLDASQAMGAAAGVKSLLDSIPDVTVKTVVVEFKTQASPLMPFTEGMRHIRETMESLPRGSDYTVRASGVPAAGRYTRPVDGARHVTFSPTINIQAAGGAGGGLAREMDSELARLWRYRRSELRRAMTDA